MHTPTRLAIGLLAIVAVGLICPGTASAQLRLAPPFGNHMVLQRGKPVKVWGDAEAGAKVKVALDETDIAATTTADDAGRWSLSLPAHDKAGGAYVMHVTAGKQTVVVKNVTYGDVWIVMGQSNMALPMPASSTAGDLASSDDADLRLRRVLYAIAKSPQHDVRVTPWQASQQTTARYFSAVGYYFGKTLRDELDVPIGLIAGPVGGTVAESWTSEDAIRGEPKLAGLVERWEKKIAEYPDLERAWQAEYDQWKQRVEAAGQDPASAKDAPRKPFDPAESRDHPGRLFNGIVAPIAGYTAKGVAWYQGESNAMRAEQYATLFPLMINDWRKAWGQDDLAFVFVQLHGVGKVADRPGASSFDDPWAEMREAQTSALDLPHTAMATAIDLGDGDKHPKNKKPVGMRLAHAAIGGIYNGKTDHWPYPQYKSMSVKGGKVIITLDQAEGITTRDGGAPGGFSIAGDNGWFIFAKAEIDNGKIVVWHENISDPKAVRYAWMRNPVPANVIDRRGLPLLPFRTDDLPGKTHGRN